MNAPLSADRSDRDRLYVVAQTVGWVSWILLNIGLGQFSRSLSSNDVCIYVATNLIGWLLSHAYREHIRRHRWIALPWTRVIWRVLVASLLLGVVWTASTWPVYRYLYTGEMPMRLSLTALFIYSAFNCFVVLFVWSALYLGYHLYDRARTSETERWQLQTSAKDAELRALKAQINPHFIFNSLNSVRALIDEDPARARQAVTQLANLLRYSLQSGQLETVPFEEELRTVNDYLALEQVRHEERLRLRIDIAPEVLNHPVPPMLLQTLVENAVKYGISSRPEGGEITLSARCEDRRLELRVTNPGELVPRPATLLSAASTGLGLRNASERLRLLFGERATVELREDPPGTVVAAVSVPLDVKIAGVGGRAEPVRGARAKPSAPSSAVSPLAS